MAPVKDKIFEYLHRMEEWGKVRHVRVEAREKQRLKMPDAVFRYETPAGPIEYVVELKPHLGHQDAHWVIEQLRRWVRHGQRGLILAPYIRDTQARTLREAGVDYMDLEGNVHLEKEGFLVQVEGKGPPVGEEKLRGRAFRPAGLKVVFVILAVPDAITWTYRRLATEAKVALRTAHLAVTDLLAQGYVAGRRTRRQVVRPDDLLAAWVHGYETHLRPRLLRGVFRLRPRPQERLLKDLEEYFRERGIPWALTGAEAGFQVTGYYREEGVTLFAGELPGDFRNQLACIPDARGNLTVLDYFCEAIALQQRLTFPLVHPLLIYAELVQEGTDRAREAAREIREQLLQPTH